MRVSIVTPTFQPGQRLERALESVRAQADVEVEHIIVDGGSTDGTVELLQGKPGVEWTSEPDAGQTDALRKGFARATGDALGWLNADDVLLPGALAAAAGALASADAVYGDCVVSADGHDSVWRAPRELTPFTLAAGEIAPQPGSLVRRDAFDYVGGLDLSYDLAMDVALWARLVAAGRRIVHVGRPLARFEVHPESKTGSVPRSAFLLEHARALREAGLADAADAALGRAAAWLAVETGLRLAPALRRTEAPQPAARAAAEAELLVVALQLRRPELVRDVRWAPLRHPETRRRLALAVRRALRKR
jgi:GT2 family glycosyltransferase